MTIWRLTQSPDLQEQLRNELKHFGMQAGIADMSESAYEQMTLINAILNEMMRLEPPLPITLRKAVRNTTVAGHVVKAGTYVVISPYAMGRSVDIWGNSALQFNPHRWIDPPSEEKPGPSPYGTLNEHGGASNHYGMLTFLKGPKGCTGERFAKAELRRIIAALVANFEWTIEQDHVPEQVGIVVVKPENGIQVRCRPLPRASGLDQGVGLEEKSSLI
jgi:cytochrome P450